MDTQSDHSQSSEPIVQVKRSSRNRAPKQNKPRAQTAKLTVGQAIKKLKSSGAFDDVSHHSSEEEEEKRSIVPKKRGRPSAKVIDDDCEQHWNTFKSLIDNQWLGLNIGHPKLRAHIASIPKKHQSFITRKASKYLYYKKKSSNLSKRQKTVLDHNSKTVSLVQSDVDSSFDNDLSQELPSQATFAAVEQKDNDDTLSDVSQKERPLTVEKLYGFYEAVVKGHNDLAGIVDTLKDQVDDIDCFYGDFKKEVDTDYQFLKSCIKDEEKDRQQDCAELQCSLSKSATQINELRTELDSLKSVVKSQNHAIYGLLGHLVTYQTMIFGMCATNAKDDQHWDNMMSAGHQHIKTYLQEEHGKDLKRVRRCESALCPDKKYLFDEAFLKQFIEQASQRFGGAINRAKSSNGASAAPEK